MRNLVKEFVDYFLEEKEPPARYIQFYYAVPDKPVTITGEKIRLASGDIPMELLREEVKAVNYSGHKGPGGHPPDGHGGAYFIRTCFGDYASIPFKDRDRTMIIMYTRTEQ